MDFLAGRRQTNLPATGQFSDGSGRQNVCKLVALLVLCMSMLSVMYYITLTSDSGGTFTFQQGIHARSEKAANLSSLTANSTDRSTPLYPVTTGPMTGPRSTTGGYRPRADRYVTFSGGFKDGRGLGNQMFDFAAVVYVAEMSGRVPVMEHVDFVQGIDQV